MAVAGATMPAQLIVYDRDGVWIAHSENRPSDILTHDIEQAYTHLLSIGRCWIPATARKALATRLHRPIRPIQMRGVHATVDE